MFYNPQGGVVYGAGNAIMAGVPLENIKAYTESLTQFCQEKKG